MKKKRVTHLRCRICDYSSELPSDYLDTSCFKEDGGGGQQKPKSSNVYVRENDDFICDTCLRLSQDDVTIGQGETPDAVGSYTIDGVTVTCYPPTHSKLTEVNMRYVTEDEKEAWRTWYENELACPMTPPGRY